MTTEMKQPKTLRGVRKYKFKSKEDFDKFLSAKNGYMNKQIADIITENGKHSWDVSFGLKRYGSGIAQLFVNDLLTSHVFTIWTMQFVEPINQSVNISANHKIYTTTFALKPEYNKSELEALIKELKTTLEAM